MRVNVKIAPFLSAFRKFLSYSDGSLGLEALASFAELKDKKKIGFKNKPQYWNENHCSANSFVELFLVEEPCTMFIVKYHYSEESDDSHSRTETTVFVPDEV